jgi:twitching motility two-component system response regulator PilH
MHRTGKQAARERQNGMRVAAPTLDEQILDWTLHGRSHAVMSSRAKTILLADADAASAQYVALLLENEGFRVVVARDGEEVLQKLRESRPHLLLLEIPLPGKNGYEICRVVKQDKKQSVLPVVFLSAKAQASDRFWAKRVGANGFVAKPFDPADLLREIHAHLTKSTLAAP